MWVHHGPQERLSALCVTLRFIGDDPGQTEAKISNEQTGRHHARDDRGDQEDDPYLLGTSIEILKCLFKFGDHVLVCALRQNGLGASHMLRAPVHFQDLPRDEQGQGNGDCKATGIEQPWWDFPGEGGPKSEVAGVPRHHDQVGVGVGVTHQLFVQLDVRADLLINDMFLLHLLNLLDQAFNHTMCVTAPLIPGVIHLAPLL